MILFWDTETTGLPLMHETIYHPDQPDVIQLAALLTEDDGTERMHFSLLVQNDRPIHPEAEKAHGLSQDLINRLGVTQVMAATVFLRIAARADFLVAHNEEFDRFSTDILMDRAKVPFDWRKPGLCTMKAATPVLNLPPTPRMVKAGINRPKSPRLEECYQHFFEESLVGAHDAMIDVRACARVFFHLRSIGAI